MESQNATDYKNLAALHVHPSQLQEPRTYNKSFFPDWLYISRCNPKKYLTNFVTGLRILCRDLQSGKTKPLPQKHNFSHVLNYSLSVLMLSGSVTNNPFYGLSHALPENSQGFQRNATQRTKFLNPYSKQDVPFPANISAAKPLQDLTLNKFRNIIQFL
jgi:hypothetical protein